MPGLPADNGEKEQKVVYAEGCDPVKDEDWYDTSIDLCEGGDDIGETLPVESITGGKDSDKLIINVSPTEFSFGLERG